MVVAVWEWRVSPWIAVDVLVNSEKQSKRRMSWQRGPEVALRVTVLHPEAPFTWKDSGLVLWVRAEEQVHRAGRQGCLGKGVQGDHWASWSLKTAEKDLSGPGCYFFSQISVLLADMLCIHSIFLAEQWSGFKRWLKYLFRKSSWIWPGWEGCVTKVLGVFKEMNVCSRWDLILDSEMNQENDPQSVSSKSSCLNGI